MGYMKTIEELIDVLEPSAPEYIAQLRAICRKPSYGLLPVGLKLHYVRGAHALDAFIKALGGWEKVIESNVYQSYGAAVCVVLPPSGSAEAAIMLVKAVERFTGKPVFSSADVKMQICTAGRLDRERAALLGCGFYLASDTIRSYVLNDFRTTVSSDDYYRRGRRILLHDANGRFERTFTWARTPHRITAWCHDVLGKTLPTTTVHGKQDAYLWRKYLPFNGERTDVFAGSASEIDILNINLIATLLVQAQYSWLKGPLRTLGEEFESDVRALLLRHELLGILSAEWVCAVREDNMHGEDERFFSALQELMNYTHDEVRRIEKDRKLRKSTLQHPGRHPGLLEEMHTLIRTYRRHVMNANLH